MPTGIDVAGERTDRGRYTETAYSQRGFAYRQRNAIDPMQSTLTFLETHTWYDENGRAVKTWSPTGPASKTVYDGLGRPESTHVVDASDDAAPGATGNHADALDVDGDIVFQETSYRYIDAEGVTDLVTNRVRAHDALSSMTGSLADLEGGTGDDPKAVITTYSASWYDSANRPIRSASYGTNQADFNYGGSAPTINQGSPPGADASDLTVLIAETHYNERGLVDTSVAPDEQVAKTFYDDMNRRIAQVENYIESPAGRSAVDISWNATDGRWNADNLGANFDEDRVTSFVYDGVGNVTKRVAHFYDGAKADDEDAQVTVYTYGVSKGAAANEGDSLVASNYLLASVTYPDGGVVDYAYNRLSEMRYMADQESDEQTPTRNTHVYTRDLLGRVTEDKVTAFRTGIDQSIDRIETTYDDLGRREFVRSKDGATTVVNAVKFTYTPLWQVKEIWQEVDGDVVTSGGSPSPKVEYAYDDNAIGSGNWTRVDSLTYPDSAVLNHDYGTADETNDVISRLEALKFGATSRVAYEYLGLGRHAIVDYPQPDVQWDASVADNGERNKGEYPVFDRFGRIIAHTWVDGDLTTHATDNTVPNIPPIARVTYEYDNAGNRTWTQDGRPGAKRSNRDWKYSYDGLDRLELAEKGVRAGASVTHDVGSQQWDLDALGNWVELAEDMTGNGLFTDAGDEMEPRTHNAANEIVDLTEGEDPVTRSGGEDHDLTHDTAGNLELDDDKSAGDADWRYTHDAWNRLVKVEHDDDAGGWDVRTEYEYNGLNWRTLARADMSATPDGVIDREKAMYYDASWRLLEERINDDVDQNSVIDRVCQQLWGTRYIDDAALRREDANADGDYIDAGDSEWNYITDAQFSVIALIRDTDALVERVAYTPYGVARHQRSHDIDGDGDADGADNTILQGATYGKSIGHADYNVDADFNRDGLVNPTDLLAFLSNQAGALDPGQISEADNPIGYDGYVFNDELGPGYDLYTVRHRFLSPDLGRWAQRDPAGYDIGASLYSFVGNNPLSFIDPTGFKRLIGLIDGQDFFGLFPTGSTFDAFEPLLVIDEDNVILHSTEDADLNICIPAPCNLANRLHDAQELDECEDDVIVLIGHSNGADAARKVANQLRARYNESVEFLVLFDAIGKPIHNVNADFTVPTNVKTAWNFFQRHSGNIGPVKMQGYQMTAAARNEEWTKTKAGEPLQQIFKSGSLSAHILIPVRNWAPYNDAVVAQIKAMDTSR